MSPMNRSSALGLAGFALTGCPYIFGPPDLSNVDRGQDTASAGFVVEAQLELDAVVLRFELDDVAGDPADATVQWAAGADGGGPVPLLDQWDEGSGRGTWRVPGLTLDCALGPQSVDYTLSVEDASGTRVAVAPLVLGVPRFNDQGPGNNVRGIGEVAAPALLCQDMRNNDTRDRYTFDHEPGGAWAITVRQVGTTEAGDALSFLIEQEGTVVLSETEAGEPVTVSPVVLTAGARYDLEISRPEQNATQPAWQIIVHAP